MSDNQDICHSIETASRIETAVCCLINATNFSLLITCLFIQRRAFHRYFCITYGLFVICYGSFVIITEIATIAKFFGRLDIAGQVLFILTPMYYFILTVNLTCAIERLGATIFYETYEKRKPWLLLAVSWTVGATISYLLTANEIAGFASEVVQIWEYGGSFFSILISAGCIMVNVRQTIRIRGGKGTLTARYQLAENIRVTQLTLIFVFFDNALTIYDLLLMEIFGFKATFEMDQCLAGPFKYAIVHLPTLIIRYSLVFSIPTLSFVFNENLRRPLNQMFSWRSSKTQDFTQQRKLEFRNVVGGRVTSLASQEAYFDQLLLQWQKDE
ncbi:unnamed protein product, partial [Mesorhabditis belari]|uniref:Gustatory receptor n=1 Tax=Mesorhabditis belari TaxID=2138241 RepID=A0AAF3ECB9_9BILA